MIGHFANAVILRYQEQLGMNNQSRMTSISFTVDDDLISQSSLNSTKRSAFRGVKPFAQHYGIDNDQSSFDNRALPNKQNKQIVERAQLDAYKQLNDGLFNPFEHKLGGNFMPRENDLYSREKRRQLQILKKKEEQMMNSNKNYTIVFKNQKKSSLQRAGENVIGEDANIGDYYKKKFMKKKEVEIIDEEDQEQGPEEENKKVNNFVGQGRKNIKSSHEKKENIICNKNNSSQKKKRQQVPVKQISFQNKLSQKQIKIQEQKQKNLTPPPPKKAQKKESQQKNINNRPQINKNQPPKPVVPRKPQMPKGQNKKSDKNLKKKKYSDVYDGPDRNLVEQLERQLTQCPSISFDDIAELQTAKNLLQQAVLLPRLMPQFFQGIRKAMKGILLFGPPGTGKTLLAKAVAKDNIFLNVSASSLASKWKGESEKMVRLLFQIAKYHSPSVIFFDEIDAICSRRSENQHQSARKVKTELLVQMDGVGSSENEVFVLAATNRPWDLDEALRRRLEKRIYIPLPGVVGRRKMFDINLKGVKISENINWDKLVQTTKGCSGADICNVCRDAAYMPMRRKINSLGGIQKLKDLSQTELIDEEITEKDLQESAHKVKPSVGKEDLKRYENWMAEFGST